MESGHLDGAKRGGLSCPMHVTGMVDLPAGALRRYDESLDVQFYGVARRARVSGGDG
jgi:hypothetical protein